MSLHTEGCCATGTQLNVIRLKYLEKQEAYHRSSVSECVGAALRFADFYSAA